jgi:hypothetical protein
MWTNFAVSAPPLLLTCLENRGLEVALHPVLLASTRQGLGTFQLVTALNETISVVYEAGRIRQLS